MTAAPRQSQPVHDALRQAKAALIKIRACSIAGCEFGYGKPEIWGDALFASHGDVANALKVIDAVLSATPEEASTAAGEVVAAALARRLCQMFDSGGESQRSARARHASAIFQLLNRDAPQFLVEQSKCDADPIAYLEAAERGELAAPPTAQADGLEEIIADLRRDKLHLIEALEFIRDGYDNHDVNHVDYRVKVYQVALDALAAASPSPQVNPEVRS